MKRFAVISNGTVINTVVANQQSDIHLSNSQTSIQHDTANIGWSIVNGQPVQPPSPPPDLVGIANRKWASVLEAGHVTVDGFTSLTAERWQGYVSRAVQLASSNPSTPIFWNGTTAISPSQLTALGNAVGAFVQAAFATLGAVESQIAAGTITSQLQIDAANWPMST